MLVASLSDVWESGSSTRDIGIKRASAIAAILGDDSSQAEQATEKNRFRAYSDHKRESHQANKAPEARTMSR